MNTKTQTQTTETISNAKPSITYKSYAALNLSKWPTSVINEFVKIYDDFIRNPNPVTLAAQYSWLDPVVCCFEHRLRFNGVVKRSEDNTLWTWNTDDMTPCYPDWLEAIVEELTIHSSLDGTQTAMLTLGTIVTENGLSYIRDCSNIFFTPYDVKDFSIAPKSCPGTIAGLIAALNLWGGTSNTSRKRISSDDMFAFMDEVIKSNVSEAELHSKVMPIVVSLLRAAYKLNYKEYSVLVRFYRTLTKRLHGKPLLYNEISRASFNKLNANRGPKTKYAKQTAISEVSDEENRSTSQGS